MLMPPTMASIKQRKPSKMITVIGGESTLNALRSLPFDDFVEVIRTPTPAELFQKKPIAIGTLPKKRRYVSTHRITCEVRPGGQVVISIDEVAEIFRERIVEAERKAYWQRKGLKDGFVALTKKLNLSLGEEFDKRLERLDDVHPGEAISSPPAPKLEDPALITRLSLFFKVKEDMTTEELEEKVRQFLAKLRDFREDVEITTYINKLKCSNEINIFNSHKLWDILHEAGLYNKTHSTWGEQVSK